MSWLALLAGVQTVAAVVLLTRLSRGRRRTPPVAPVADGIADTTVSVIVATLDEAERIAPCLAGLRAQGEPMIEVLVVDSRSTDGTAERVLATSAEDSRFQLHTDPPLPAGWVGKVWALQHGLSLARGEWVMGVDADTAPEPGMVAGAVAAARAASLDVVSFSPCFSGHGAGVLWLQPSLLTTLVYRFGAAGDVGDRPDRVMANGQCFLARREVLERHGGYSSARASFADDVTLARHLARRGERVGFLDGSRLYRVASYRSVAEAWREWGRSIDLKDATSAPRQWLDVAFLLLVQGIPLPLLAARGLWHDGSLAADVVTTVSVALVAVRVLLLFGLARSYDRLGWSYWLSPLSDPAAALRILISTLRRPRSWRGRRYDQRFGEEPHLASDSTAGG